ncbi:FtsW/RodA/SpoVE family cell cycle protein [Ectobacillus ponti]|uniref:Probable peptidoglycan glycosyltransferase FtsW n=1 Tax=Ectobacillus ponti TaxID=2961894 RepID=A0AA42BS80_9BACI|nr:FtsW/RodA/SpoVE family cell cycle protein [Ectobacillus ponti]MCP8970284.1 FtsW/RodA/SpoVE family cell cycle protein [Ectobacillus ponti]
MKRMWKSLDYSLVLPFIILCTLGLIMVYSTSSIVVVLKFSDKPLTYFFVKQLKALGIGVVAMVALAVIPYEFWRKRLFVWLLYGGSIGVLVLLLFKGTKANGAQLWLFGVQPSEFVKIAFILLISRFFARRQETGTALWQGVVPVGLYILVIFGLMLKPDLGTSLILGGMLLCMLFCSGIRPNKFISRTLLLSPVWVPLLYFSMKFVISRMPVYQQARFIAYEDPFGTQQTFGYQLVSSFVAIASGGFSGLGLGNSVQKLGYLPEPHTDFILAVVSEELGFLGVAIILGCLLLLIVRSLRLAQRSQDSFGSMIAIGVAGMLGIQTFINVGGITGIIPLTGVPLPFISSGGSSLMASCMAVGLLLNVSSAVRRQDKSAAPENQQARPQLAVVK